MADAYVAYLVSTLFVGDILRRERAYATLR